MNDKTRGQVITFYSYKGGTGRTMALANVACLLARRQPAARVLIVDWDLEAPGLHRYFRNRSLPRGAEDPDDDKPGLIDLFYELDKKTDALLEKSNASSQTEPGAVGMDSEALARATLDEARLDDYVLKTEVDSLYIMRAGRFDPRNPELYPSRVNTFPWEALYKKSPKLIRVLAERLAERYQYVLIDSRTGITDISGICTMLMPEKLVVVFTPNRQSMLGGLQLIERVTAYRRESSDLRPLVVFPLVSRVETGERRLKDDWRFGNDEMVGYQPAFERILKAVYRLESISLDHYFDEMQIQQLPLYAYGEEIAVLSEKSKDRLSLSWTYDSFATKLVEARAPWVEKDEVTEAVKPEEPGRFGSLRERIKPFPRWLRLHLSQAVAVGLALVAFSLLFFSVVRGQRTEAALLKSQSDLKDANEKLQKVSSYTTVLDQNQKTIDDLNNMLAAALAEREQANQSALNANSQLSAAQSALQSARAQLHDVLLAQTQADQMRRLTEQARAEAVRSLEEVQQLRQANSAVEAKYQELLKKCGRSGE